MIKPSAKTSLLDGISACDAHIATANAKLSTYYDRENALKALLVSAKANRSSQIKEIKEDLRKLNTQIKACKSIVVRNSKKIANLTKELNKLNGK